MKFKTMEVWPTLKALKDKPASAYVHKTTALDRIKAGDGQLHAFLSLDDSKTDPDSPEPGILSGIPLAVKDNIAVKNMPLTCASRVLENHRAVFDATVITKLKSSGAMIIGKTNMDEFAMGSSTENSAFATSLNPWDMTRVPGGSSGGSAAAVAAGFVPAALGSDTGGSVRLPAAFCGIAGFKPSYGAVSRFGLVAYGSSLDQIGIMSRYTEDIRLLFDIVRGHDPLDQSSVHETADPLAGKKKYKFAVISEFAENSAVESCIREALWQSAEIIKKTGHSVSTISLPFLDQTLIPAYYLTACAEASSNLSRFDGVRYGSREGDLHLNSHYMTCQSRSLFGTEVKLRICLGNYILRAGHYDKFYGKAQIARRRIAAGFRKAFQDFDFLLLPVFPTRAFKPGEFQDDPLALKLADLFTVTANLAGLPAISLPVALSDGLPVALQIMGPRFADHSLLTIAQSLEEELKFPGCVS